MPASSIIDKNGKKTDEKHAAKLTSLNPDTGKEEPCEEQYSVKKWGTSANVLKTNVKDQTFELNDERKTQKIYDVALESTNDKGENLCITYEIINLQSVINLPKGTEHFLSDIHGEYEAFSHVLRNGSGAVRKKIDDVFGHTLGISEKRALATLIYYPRERLEMEKKQQEDIDDWYKVMLYRLIDVCKIVSSKYTRAKVRKALPADYGYIIEELITEKPEVLDKEAYYEAIIQTILEIGSAENFIIAVAELIQRLVVDHLHIIGDIFDRGPEPYKIMDCLMNYHSLDIQWGNHDVLWMGAATGQPACVASTIRICLHYGNLDVLEDGYGINMLPLATFALETYGDDPCECFAAKGGEDSGNSQQMLERRMHKAITVMQLKLENRLIRENPEYGMENRRLLEKINYQNGTVTIGEKTYALRDKSFPTIDPAHPDELTEKEAEVLDKLIFAFVARPVCRFTAGHFRKPDHQ